MTRKNTSKRRWMTPDPTGGDITNPQSLPDFAGIFDNRYAYAMNNPVSFIDPSGLSGCSADDTTSVDTGGGPGVIHVTSWAPCPDPETPVGILTPQASAFPSSGSSGSGGSGSATDSAANPTNPSPCRIVDPILGSIEWTWKLGPEVEVGPVKAGASIYKNAMTGATGGKAEFGTSFLAGFEADNPTPEGGNLGGTTEGVQYSGYFFGFRYNFDTRKWTFSPAKTFFFGLGGLLGGEWSFNSDKFKQINKANQICRSQGGE